MIIKQLFSQWLATLYVGFASFAVSVFIARTVGPATFGEYSLAVATGGILAVFIDGGMRSLLTREHVRNSQHLKHLSGQLPWIAFIHALSVTTVASLLAYALLRDHLALALATIACFFGVTLVQFISAILRGEGRLLADAGWQMGQRTFSAVCIVSIILLGFDSAWHILVAWTGGSIICVLIFPYGLNGKPLFKFQMSLYRTTLPLLWISFATAIYFRSDMIMLQWLGVSQDEIGQYAAAFRLIEAVILLANPLAILLFRRMRKTHDNLEMLGRDIPRAALLGAFIGLVCVLVFYYLAGPIVSMTYGSKYPDASTVLIVLSVALVFVLPNAVFTNAALALELDRPYAWAASAAAIVNIVLNFIFIERYGLFAAAWSTIAAEAILMVVLIFALSVKLKQRGLY